MNSNVCKECSTIFESRRSDKKFCTDQCRVAFNNKKTYSAIKVKISGSEKMKKAIGEFIMTIVDEKSSDEQIKIEYSNELIKRFNGIYQQVGA